MFYNTCSVPTKCDWKTCGPAAASTSKDCVGASTHPREGWVGSWGFIPDEPLVELRCQWRPCGEPGILPSDSSSVTHTTPHVIGPLGEPERQPCPAGKRSPPLRWQRRPVGSQPLPPGNSVLPSRCGTRADFWHLCPQSPGGRRDGVRWGWKADQRNRGWNCCDLLKDRLRDSRSSPQTGWTQSSPHQDTS